MKNKIYGRKVGSKDDMALLIEGGGVSTGGVKADQGELVQFAVASTRRAVQGTQAAIKVIKQIQPESPSK